MFPSCCLTHMDKRKALCNRFDLHKDCNDCMATIFCGSCGTCQEACGLKFCLPSSEDIFIHY